MIQKTVSTIKERVVDFLSNTFMSNFGELDNLELEIDMENLIEN